MSIRGTHGVVTIGNKVYNWGGNRPDLPEVHRGNRLKDSLTSKVEVFDMESLSWNSVATTGVPPAAMIEFACCSVGSKMYTFGGSCIPDNCYHNDLFAFDTLNNEWREVVSGIATKSPMKKQGSEMVSFTSNNEEFLFVFGGYGPTPTRIPSDGQFIPHPNVPNTTSTNEVHMMQVSSSSTGWTVPVVTGTIPPIAFCTLNTLPSQDKAILFGGGVVDGLVFRPTNSVYILTLRKNQVHFQQLHCTNSPMGRQAHSSTVVTINGSVFLIITGGTDFFGKTISDFWILDIKAKQWKKVHVPDSVCERYGHATASIKVTHNRVWIVINGGFRHVLKDIDTCVFVTGADVTVLVELMYSNGDWSVVNVWNSEQLTSNRSQIHRQLVQHLIDQNYDKGTLYELINIMQSSTKGLKYDDHDAELGLAQKLYQDQKEENKKLQSDVTLSRVALLYKQQELNQSREIAEDQKKRLLGHTMELEKLRKEKNVSGHATTGEKNKESNTDKITILKEENERLQQMVDEMEESLKQESVNTEVIRDQKKRLLGQSMELEKLRKKGDASGQVTTGEENESVTDKLTILKKENETLQRLVKKLFSHYKSDLSTAVLPRSSSASTLDKHTQDVGVQFNYVSRETDRLEGVCRFGSQLFTITGDQPHSFIWDGFGFEFHVPEGTCPVDSECDVMVDVAMGGDFVFPEGVEPVSAIYIISVAAKLLQPSLLKIQHCVALDEAMANGDSSQLSFYRATLKEPTPPYHFKRVKGGKFDISNKYGQLELPVFCAMAIGKESVSSDESIGSDTKLDRQPQQQTVDSSILFHGQMFYLENQLNHWEMKLIVVKHLQAFTNYVSTKLSNHEESASFSFRFNTHNIELILMGDGANDDGWTVELFVKPCAIPFKHAMSFGHSKEVCIPPTCLVDVYAELPNCIKRLNYPIKLQGALTGDTPSQTHPQLLVYVKRTLKEKNDLPSSATTVQEPKNIARAQFAAPDVDYYQVFVNHLDELGTVVDYPLDLAQSLRGAGIVSQKLVDNILNSKEPKDVDVTRLFKGVRNLLKVSKKEQLREKMKILCKVLSDQDDPALTVIATQILEECGLPIPHEEPSCNDTFTSN